MPTMRDVSTVVPLKFADQLYEDILASIVAGKLPEGERLPAHINNARARILSAATEPRQD